MGRTKAKSTAAGVAALRAAGALERDPAVRNPDYFVVHLLGPWLRAVSKVPPLVRLVIKLYERILPGGYHFHIARTKHIDTVLLQRLEEGIKQVVILGAGYDTRAYRFRELLTNITVFELDYPPTQVVKKERVGACPTN